MAEKQEYGGLSGALDMTKTPLYGVSDEQYQSLKDAQQQALEQKP